MLLSLIVPVFNNAPLITPFLDELSGLSVEWPFFSEAIFIDDASTDASRNVLNESVNRLPISSRLICLEQNKDQGKAIVEGLKNASGDFALTFSVDMKENLSDIQRILAEFMERNSPIMHLVRQERKYPSASRKIVSLLFNSFLKLIGLNMFDIGSSLYMAKKAYYQKLIRPEYGQFHAALPVLIWKLSGTIPTFPITDRSAERHSSSYAFRKLTVFAWQMVLSALRPLPQSSEPSRNTVQQI